MSAYVVHGAKLRCSFGTQISTFQVDRNAFICDKPQGNMMDYKSDENIFSFGLCFSLANPDVQKATSAAGGVLQMMPCKPNTKTPWLLVKEDVLVDSEPALLDCSQTLCMWAGLISITDNGQ